MDPITIGMLSMAALGALKGKTDIDRAKQIENSDRKLASETARYSPWTGMQPQQIRQAPSAFGTMLGSGMQGAGFGAMLGQGMAGKDNKPDLYSNEGQMVSDTSAETNPNAYDYKKYQWINS